MDGFGRAFGLTMQHEGGFVNDPVDPGGMTYMGISRRWWPAWEGWPLVDAHLADGTLMSLDQDLADLVRVFYRINFWNRLQGDRIAEMSLDVVCELFDTAVNLDVVDAVKFFQEALNLLNKNQLLFPDLVVDGKLGPKTFSTLKRFLSFDYPDPKKNEKILLKVMNILQGTHYVQQMRSYPENEKFVGWFQRA